MMTVENDNEMTMDDLEMERIEEELENLLSDNALLASENELYEVYIKRNAAVTFAIKTEEDKKTKKQRGRQKVLGQLSMEQKLEIATCELEEAQKEIEESKKGSERLIDTLRAVLEEADVRIAELKKDAYEFKRDIVVGAENFRTGKTMAEKVVRYMEEKLRQKDALMEKLRLKNANLKVQGQKIDAQVRTKEEMGDVLHYIDFHQLQIENKQYVAKIEERNDELLRLKMTTGNTVQSLNHLKRKLRELMDQSSWLTNELKVKNDNNNKVKVEIDSGRKNIIKERKSLQKMNSTVPVPEGNNEDSMPKILDYVAQKANMYELQKEVADLERKLEIAENAEKQRKRESRLKD